MAFKTSTKVTINSLTINQLGNLSDNNIQHFFAEIKHYKSRNNKKFHFYINPITTVEKTVVIRCFL